MNRAKHATRLLCGEVLIAGIPGPALTADAQQPVLLEPADEWRVEKPKDGVKP